MFLKMWQKGDIYKDEYEGHYCISCESFLLKVSLLTIVLAQIVANKLEF